MKYLVVTGVLGLVCYLVFWGDYSGWLFLVPFGAFGLLGDYQSQDKSSHREYEESLPDLFSVKEDVMTKQRVKFLRITSERGFTNMTVVWAPDTVLPGVYDITFFQETGNDEATRKRQQVEVSLCKKTMQEIVDRIFEGTA